MSTILVTQSITSEKTTRKAYFLYEIYDKTSLYNTINSIHELCTNETVDTIGKIVCDLHNTGTCKQIHKPTHLKELRLANKGKTDWEHKTISLQNVTDKPIRMLLIVNDSIFNQVKLRNEVDKVLKIFVKSNKCVFIKTEKSAYKVTEDEIKIDTDHVSSPNRISPYVEYETFIGINEFVRKQCSAKTLIVGATYKFTEKYYNENRDKINIDILNGTFILADSAGYTQLHNSKGEKLFNLLNQYDEERNNIALTLQEVLEFMERSF